MEPTPWVKQMRKLHRGSTRSVSPARTSWVSALATILIWIAVVSMTIVLIWQMT